MASALLAAYRTNKLIWKELDYYHTRREVLGQHPIFKVFVEMQKTKTLPITKQIAKRNATQKAIREIKSQLKKNDRPDLKEKRQENLQYHTDILVELDKHFDSLG